MRSRTVVPAVLLIWSALAAAACFAGPESRPPVAGAPIVYVSDFELDAPPIQDNNAPSGVLGRVRQGGLLRRHADPQADAQEMSALMADTLTQDLKQAGLDARRVPPGVTLPHTGWNVHGVFFAVDEGNVVRRAVIGFGAGSSSLQVAVAIDDLAKPGQPLFQAVAGGSGGHMPGAIIARNPYAIAAKVVLAGRDRDKAVKHAAKQIADVIVQRVHAQAPTSADAQGTPQASPDETRK